MKITNRNAIRNYQILESLEAGVVLSGAEAKSLRAGRVDLSEAFVRILNEEAYLLNALIPIENASIDTSRSRKLLLHKNQIRSLIGKVSGKHLTLMPISIYQKNNRFKVQIGLCKSKKEFDRRKQIKEKDLERKLEQELREKV